MKKNYWHKLFSRIFGNEKIDNYAIYLIEGYEEDLSKEDYIFLKKCRDYAKVGNKIKLLFDVTVKKYSIKGTMFLKFALIFNRMERV